MPAPRAAKRRKQELNKKAHAQAKKALAMAEQEAGGREPPRPYEFPEEDHDEL